MSAFCRSWGGLLIGCGGSDPDFSASLGTSYQIDYENGAIPLHDLPIGARVVDPSWEWEYRSGENYGLEGGGQQVWIWPPVKPVTWIVVAKDHYAGTNSHVTLLSEELIGFYAFDNSTDRWHEYAEYGHNHWGDSGLTNADRGLRPWLNSTGIHREEGFCRAFSERFKARLSSPPYRIAHGIMAAAIAPKTTSLSLPPRNSAIPVIAISTGSARLTGSARCTPFFPGRIIQNGLRG